MSLLDDVNIVVTPNGYKAGELYAVIPVPTLGAELVDDGDFPTPNTEWTISGEATISGGMANIISTAGVNTGVTQTVPMTTGLRYRFQYEVVSNDAGFLKTDNTDIQSTNLPSTVGVHFIDFINTLNAAINFKRSSGVTDISITNVSVKEYTAADMDVTRATDATRVNEDGLIADVLSNVPRIDYTGGGCPHILAEPQRTNLVTYSSDFSQSYWTKQSGVTATYNTTETLSPDGTYNATKLVGNGTTGIFKTSISVSGVVSRSFYLKSVTGTTTAVFKEPNTNVPAPISLTITNEWQRFEMIGDNGSAFQGLQIDDITSDGLYIWGAQLEVGSYATSYIPTSGSTVTRNQDIFTRDGIGSLINSTEGVLFVELENITGTDATNKMISITDGSLTNKISLFVSSNQISVESAGSGTNLGIYSKALQSGFNKIAVKYKVNDCALWVNGTEYTDTSFAAFSSSTLNALVFDRGDGTQNLFGKVKQLQVYKTALTDEQLLQLTGESGTDFYESYAEMASALTYTIQ